MAWGIGSVALAAALAVSLAGCGGKSVFGDGVIDINGDGEGISRVKVEIIGLKALKRGAEICVTGEALLFDVKNPCAGDADKQAIAAKAIPYLDDAITALSPLIDSTDQAAIDKAFELAAKARGML